MNNGSGVLLYRRGRYHHSNFKESIDRNSWVLACAFTKVFQTNKHTIKCVQLKQLLSFTRMSL